MMQRLRDKLQDFFSSISYRFQKFRQRRQQERMMREPVEVIRGTSRRVIVVRPPDNRLFQEVVFIMRDEFLRSPGISKKELLQQANAAAKEYTGSVLPPVVRSPSPLVSLLLFICGSAAAVAALMIMGVI